MTPQHYPLRVVLLSALTLAVAAGCASEAYQAKAKKEKEEQRAAIASGKYVWYTPVGSSIPILVPKDAITTSDDQREKTQNAMRDAQQAGMKAHSDGESAAATHPATR